MTQVATKNYFSSAFHADRFERQLEDIATVWQTVLGWTPLRVVSQFCYEIYLLCFVSPLLYFYINTPGFSFFGWQFGGWGGKTYPDICAQMTPATNPNLWTNSEANMQECSVMVFRQFHSFMVMFLSLVYLFGLLLFFWCMTRMFRAMLDKALGKNQNRANKNPPPSDHHPYNCHRCGHLPSQPEAASGNIFGNGNWSSYVSPSDLQASPTRPRRKTSQQSTFVNHVASQLKRTGSREAGWEDWPDAIIASDSSPRRTLRKSSHLSHSKERAGASPPASHLQQQQVVLKHISVQETGE